jgi:hypothetical protein
MYSYGNGKWLGAAFVTLAVFGLFAASAHAQWSSDPSLNLLVADGSSSQTQPKIGITNSGGCFVSWFDFGASGGYAVRIQYFNAIGEPQFDPEITLFQTTLSWSQDYGLDVDGAGNAIVACQITVGSETHAGVQKVTQDGELPWGAAGVQASVIPGVSKPYVAATSDGYYIVGWGESSDYLLQKFDADGVPQWAEPYRELHGDTGSFSMGGMCSGGNGTVIVQYVHATGGMYSPKYIEAQKYDGDANKLWNDGDPVVIMDGYSLGMGYFPGFISDGQGGAVIGWYDGTIGVRRARVQHLNSDGIELLSHDGVEAAVPTDGKIALSTSVAYDQDNDEIYVGFTQSNSAQTAWGLWAQRIDSDGTRAWGDQALGLIPLSSLQCAYPRALWINGAFELFCVPSTAPTGAPIQGYRLDSQGTQLWDDVPLIVSSAMSEKSNTLTAAATPSGMAILAWGDGRGGSYADDIYAQNVNPDGSLGLPVFLWGDVNHDNSVNLTDLGQLLSHYGHTGMTYEDGDLDGDGDVDISDLAMLLAHYGEGV